MNNRINNALNNLPQPPDIARQFTDALINGGISIDPSMEHTNNVNNRRSYINTLSANERRQIATMRQRDVILSTVPQEHIRDLQSRFCEPS
jgi:hypothetical protein